MACARNDRLLSHAGHKGGRPRALSEQRGAATVRIASDEPLTRAQIANGSRRIGLALSRYAERRAQARRLHVQAQSLFAQKTQRRGIRREKGHPRENASSRHGLTPYACYISTERASGACRPFNELVAMRSAP